MAKKLILSIHYRYWASIEFILFLLFVLLNISVSSGQESNQKLLISSISAVDAYQNGFVKDVMLTPNKDGIQLNDLVLFENDAPGAGLSEKGEFFEYISSSLIVRKQFFLEDSTAKRAHIILYLNNSKDVPYYIEINGTRFEGIPAPWKDPSWRWIEIPVSSLKKGINDVIVGCDTKGDSKISILFSREDEYDFGGGKYIYGENTSMIGADQIRPGVISSSSEFADSYLEELRNADKGRSEKLTFNPNSFSYFQPSNDEIRKNLREIKVGSTSAKSYDGGANWLIGRLGSDDKINGEYTIRLHLERYKSHGILDSHPIDLWTSDTDSVVVSPKCEVKRISLRCDAVVPDETGVTWLVRFSNSPDMLGDSWGAWDTLGNVSNIEYKILNEYNSRYIQWRAVLNTNKLTRSPIVQNVGITRLCDCDYIPNETFYVIESENVRHKYSSFGNTYENFENFDAQILRNKLNLDSIIESSNGDFGLINELRNRVSELWYWTSPSPNYPEWNALDILDRNDEFDGGGMCIQFATVLFQALQSVGYSARHVNIFNHEVVEAYIDELGKWVYLDPTASTNHDNYEFNSETGIPLSILEQHKIFLEELGFSSINKIDWMKTTRWAFDKNGIVFGDGESQDIEPTNFSSFREEFHPSDSKMYPYKRAGYIRFIPRSDFLTRMTPRPLAQGETFWPWNGYLNWYDEATPRRLEYALHTDRISDFYPTLNRIEYVATHGENIGEIGIELFTVTPNFKQFEIKINNNEWEIASDKFVWELTPSSLNTIKMRTRNAAGVCGKSSVLKIFWHYRP